MSERQRRARGFDLVEVAISAVALILLLGSAFGALQSSLQVAGVSAGLGGAEESASRVMDRLAEEIRWSDPSVFLLSKENATCRLDFRYAEDFVGGDITWSNVVTYRYEPSANDFNGNGIVDEGAIVRIQNGRRTVLCRNVPEGGFDVQVTDNRVCLELQVFAATRSGPPVCRTVTATASFRNQEF